MEIDKTLLKNYHKSLGQKYTAICLDIDGTLTKNNSKEIDERVIKKLIELLDRKIPIVFITGRGETGLKDFVNDVVPIMIEKYNISINQMSRLYILINDGARLFKTSANSNRLFDISEYLVSESSLKGLESLNKLLNQYKNLLCGKNSLIT